MPFASSQMIFLYLIAVAVILEAIADVLFKKWTLESSAMLLAIGLAAYFIGTVFWAISLKYQMLSRAVVFFTVANALIVALIGIYMFREQLSLMNKIGIALGVVSLLLIEM